MYTKLFEDLNKNTKLFWNAVDVYTTSVNSYVAAEQKSRNTLNDATWKFFKQSLEVKSPEKIVALQIETAKELTGTVQKIVDENISLSKTTGEKYGQVVESFVKEAVKPVK